MLEPGSRERLNELKRLFEGVSLAKITNAMIACVGTSELYHELQARGHMPDLEALFNAIDSERKRK